MGGIFNDIGESLANLVGAGPSGGPLGALKPIAQPITDVAAVALAPETGGLSLAIPAAEGVGDLATGKYLPALGNLASVGGGLYGLGASGAGAAGAGAGAAAPGAGVSAGAGGVGAAGAATPGVLDTIEQGASTLGSNVSGDISNLLGTTGASAPGVASSELAPAGLDSIGQANFAADSAALQNDSDPISAVLNGGGTSAAASPSIFSKLGSLLSSNKWLIPAIGGAGTLLKQALTPTPSGQAGVANAAAAENGLVGQSNAALGQQLQEQIAAIRAHYASLGESGSSAELQDIAAAQNNEQGTQFNITSGIVGQAGQQYGNLAQLQYQNDQDLSSAISDFALAAGLGFGASK